MSTAQGRRARTAERVGAWSTRSPLVTGGYVLAGAALTLVPGVGIEWYPADRDVVRWGGLVVIGILGVLHLARGRHPRLVLVAVAAVGVVEALATGTTSLGAVLIACDALYCAVVATSSDRHARLLPVLAAACLSLAVGGLVLANVLVPPLVPSTVLLLAIGVTLWWGVTVRMPMTEAERERERAALAAQAAAAERREALTAERLQISRELHDTISGQLSAIALQSAAAVAASSPADPARAGLVGIRALSLEAMGDMRRLIDVLRADGPLGSASAQGWGQLDALVDRARSAGADVRVVGDDPAGIRLDPLASVAAYNVVREGLTNAARHAPGAPVVVGIHDLGDRVALTLENRHDPGRPEPAVRGGHGLLGLAERVRLCGGEARTERSDDRWILRAVLPQTPAPSGSGPREARHA